MPQVYSMSSGPAPEGEGTLWPASSEKEPEISSSKFLREESEEGKEEEEEKGKHDRLNVLIISPIPLIL